MPTARVWIFECRQENLKVFCTSWTRTKPRGLKRRIDEGAADGGLQDTTTPMLAAASLSFNGIAGAKKNESCCDRHTDKQNAATTVLPQTTTASAHQGRPTTVAPDFAASSCLQQLRRSLQLQIQFQLHLLDVSDFLDGLDSLFHGPQIPTQDGARPSQRVAPAESARSLFVSYQQ